MFCFRGPLTSAFEHGRTVMTDIDSDLRITIDFLSSIIPHDIQSALSEQRKIANVRYP